MLVERRLQVSKKGKSASGLTMKTLEGNISFVGDDKDPNVILKLACALDKSLTPLLPPETDVSLDQMRRLGF